MRERIVGYDIREIMGDQSIFVSHDEVFVLRHEKPPKGSDLKFLKNAPWYEKFYVGFKQRD